MRAFSARRQGGSATNTRIVGQCPEASRCNELVIYAGRARTTQGNADTHAAIQIAAKSAQAQTDASRCAVTNMRAAYQSQGDWIGGRVRIHEPCITRHLRIADVGDADMLAATEVPIFRAGHPSVPRRSLPATGGRIFSHRMAQPRHRAIISGTGLTPGGSLRPLPTTLTELLRGPQSAADRGIPSPRIVGKVAELCLQ
jgi:hypothetical protein